MPSNAPRIRNPDGALSLTPQARQLGFDFDVYCTQAVWNTAISHPKVTADQRIFGLLFSLAYAIGQAMSNDNADLAVLDFEHYRALKDPAKKKERPVALKASLYREPAKGITWILILDPRVDNVDSDADLAQQEPHNGNGADH